MSDLHETLSRLLDAELSPALEAAIRARIAQDPEVAAAWDRMRALRTALDEVVEEPAPAWLDAKVIQAASSRAGTRESRGLPRWGWAVAVLAAAALGAIVLLPGLWTPPPTRLLHGSEWIDGRVTLLAGDATVQVDGLALVTVEPRGGPVRVPPQEDDMNPTSHIIAALAGAAVTVAVYEGTARIAPAGAEPIEVAAGQTRTVGAPEGRPVRRVVVGPGKGVPASALPAAPVDLPPGASPEEQVAALRDHVARLEFENALMRGQIVLDQGEPSPWPDAVPSDLEPDAFESRLRTALDKTGVGEIKEIDCSEYPCVAFVSLGNDIPLDELHPILEEIGHEVGGDSDAGVMQMVMRQEGDDGQGDSVMAVSALPEDAPEGLEKRVGFRTQSWLETNHANAEAGER